MYSVQDEISSYLRRSLINISDMAQEHRQADSPPKVQERMAEVKAEFERLIYAYEAEQGIEF